MIMHPGIKLRHIRAFLDIAADGSLSAVARRQGISQPALSRTLAELEDLLAVALFRREKRRLGLTGEGAGFVAGFGIDLAALQAARPPICRDCLDWSARRSHLGGRLGRAFLQAIEAKDWARRSPGSRAIAFTPEGARRFALAFPAQRADELSRIAGG